LKVARMTRLSYNYRGFIPFKSENPRIGSAGFVPSDLIGGAKMPYPTTNSYQSQDETIPNFIRVVQYIYDTQVVGHYDSSNPLRETEHFIQFFNVILDGVETELKRLNEQKVQYLRRMDYQEYLQTDHWQALRKLMLEYANYRCQLCNDGTAQLHVHHRTYINRGQEPLSDLIVLCANCHQQFHDKLEVAK
jgi:5-methylcytosine-specific restriction endonuclease McrA